MYNRTALNVLLILAVFLSSWSGMAEAAAFKVTKTADTADGACDPTDCSLREAIIAANAESGAETQTITLPAGTYTLTLSGSDEDHALTGDLDIRSNLVLQGEDMAKTIIQACDNRSGPCTGIDRVFDIRGTINVAMSDLTIRNGSLGAATDQQGGGIYNSGAGLILNRVTLEGNATPQDGGGIYNISGGVTFLSSSVRNNTAGRSGGGIFNGGASGLTIQRSTISGNTAATLGGGIANNGAMTLINATLSGNRTTSGTGGGVDTAIGTVSFNQVTITENKASTLGGGLNASSGTVGLRNTLLAGNTSETTPSKDCSGALLSQGHNFLGINSSCLTPAAGDQVGTAASPINPMLGPLAENGGLTPTHALLLGSPAIDVIDPSDCSIIKDDQRGGLRPADGDANSTALCDIGAFESAADISASFSFQDFGSVKDGESSVKTIVFSNEGTANLLVGTLTIEIDGSEFIKQGDTCSGQTVAPAASCTVDLVFSPTFPSGSKVASLHVQSNDPDASVLIISLRGSGTPVPVPNISVGLGRDLQAAFGPVVIGTTLDRSLTVSNTGSADLTLGNIAGADPLSAPFRILSDGCSGKTIAPLANCTLTLRFQPTAAGDFSIPFDIPSNDPDTASLIITATGTGVGPSSGINHPPVAPVLISPTDGQSGLGTTVTFSWNPSADPDGDPVRYQIEYCSSADFSGCNPIDVASGNNKTDHDTGIVLSSGGLMVVVGIVLNRFGRKRGGILIGLLLIAGTAFVACGSGGGGGKGGGAPVLKSATNFTASGLSTGTTYSWKVIAEDGKGGRTESTIGRFSTQ